MAMRTEIRFVSGIDSVTRIPKLVRLSDLRRRFAVIQDTYRSDSAEMYFDEALWCSLFEFAKQYAPAVRVSIVLERDIKEMLELSVDAFDSYWRILEDRCPPPFVLVRDSDKLVLFVATEYWNRVGGPMPYHDSYTYSLFSREDVSQRAVDFLRNSETAQQWDMSSEIGTGTIEELPVDYGKGFVWKWLDRLGIG